MVGNATRAVLIVKRKQHGSLKSIGNPQYISVLVHYISSLNHL